MKHEKGDFTKGQKGPHRQHMMMSRLLPRGMFAGGFFEEECHIAFQNNSV